MMLRIFIALTTIYSTSLLYNRPESFSFFFWRRHLILYTGFLGLGFMGIAMLLAMRPRWLEKPLGGLDKIYKHHRQAGIWAAVTIGLHWLAVKAGPWAVSSGLVEAVRRRGSRGQGFNIRHMALEMGEWALYLMLFMVAVSLISAFSYKRFSQLHKLGGIIFILGAIHSILLLPSQNHFALLILTTWVLSIAGCIFAFISLTGSIGKSNKTRGTISAISRHNNDLLVLSITLNQPITFQAGQFAFLDFIDGEKSHPFTFTDYNPETNEVEFAIKTLGDYTTTLFKSLSQNQSVTLEGPYGQFLYTAHPKQIWVGAGIGIAPFVAMVRNLARGIGKPAENIELYYRVHKASDAVFAECLNRMAESIPGLNITVIASDRNETLTAADLAANYCLDEYKVLFSGPVHYGETLKNELISKGLPSDAFHKEFFEFR